MREMPVELHHVRVERTEPQQPQLHVVAQRHVLRASMQRGTLSGIGGACRAGHAVAVPDDEPVGRRGLVGGRGAGLCSRRAGDRSLWPQHRQRHGAQGEAAQRGSPHVVG